MLMGWVLVANALPELPAFFFFGALLRTLGMNTLLLTAAGALGARIYAFAVGQAGLCWCTHSWPAGISVEGSLCRWKGQWHMQCPTGVVESTASSCSTVGHRRFCLPAAMQRWQARCTTTTNPDSIFISCTTHPWWLPLQLLPTLGLRWAVLIESMHAITYACGWSGKQQAAASPHASLSAM